MVLRKSVITFGMVAIPIAMYTATQDNDIHFNQRHKEDNSRSLQPDYCKYVQPLCLKMHRRQETLSAV